MQLKERAATVSSSGHLKAVLATSRIPTSFSVQAVVHSRPLRMAAA